MVTFTNILYPTDLSEAAAPGLSYAAAMARWYKARLTILHVVPTFDAIAVPPDAIGSPETVVQPPPRDVVLDEMKASMSEDTIAGIEVRFDAVAGDAFRMIVDRAIADGASLIVMGTHGRRGFDRLVHGSVTERVLHYAPCPVLTIPPHMPPIDGALFFRRILCPVDFSPASLQAFGFARDLAAQSQGVVTLLHVMEWLPDMVPMAGESGVAVEYRDVLISDADRRLRELALSDEHAWSEIQTQVTSGRSHRAILAAAEQHHSDLIVMGAQGRGGTALTLFGSTTNQIIRQADRPVLVVRPAGAPAVG